MDNDGFRRLFTETQDQIGGGGGPKNRGFLGRATKMNQATEAFAPRSVQPKRSVQTKAAQPKGTKLAKGYTDRAAARQRETSPEPEAGEEVEGGSLATTHLVKGLDWKLLERVKRGEDVYSNTKDDEVSKDDELDAELDALAEKEVERAPTSGKPQGKRTRDEILAELKASRQGELNEKWRKVTGRNPPVQVDKKGREVRYVTMKDGRVKKVVRKVKPQADSVMDDMSKAEEGDRGTSLGEEPPGEAVQADAKGGDEDPMQTHPTTNDKGSSNPNAKIVDKDGSAEPPSPDKVDDDDDDDDDEDIFTDKGRDYNPLSSPSSPANSEGGRAVKVPNPKELFSEPKPSERAPKANLPKNIFPDRKAENKPPLPIPIPLPVPRPSNPEREQEDDTLKRRQEKLQQHLRESERDNIDVYGEDHVSKSEGESSKRRKRRRK